MAEPIIFKGKLVIGDIIPDPSLLLHFKFDNIDGTLIKDHSGHRNHGILKAYSTSSDPVANTRLVEGPNTDIGGIELSYQLGQSGLDNNLRSCIVIQPSYSTANFGDNFTLAMWTKGSSMYFNTGRDSEGADVKKGLSWVADGSGNRPALYMNYHLGNDFSIARLPTTDPFPGVVWDVWNHYAISYDGLMVRHYFNGVLRASQEVGFIDIKDNGYWMLNARKFPFDSPGNVGTANCYADFRVYNRVLVDSEIIDLL